MTSRGTLVVASAHDDLRRDGVWYPEHVQVTFWDGRPGGAGVFHSPIWAKRVVIFPNSIGAAYRSEHPVPSNFLGDRLVITTGHRSSAHANCCHPRWSLTHLCAQPICGASGIS